MQGLGVLIHSLSGGSPQSGSTYYGRLINDVKFDADELYITFADGITIKIFDDGWSCCESRYMRTDDNPRDLVGHKLCSIVTKSGPTTEDGSGLHEVQFLEIQAGDQTVTFSNHNEHNGYYSGFGLSITEIEGSKWSQTDCPEKYLGTDEDTLA